MCYEDNEEEYEDFYDYELMDQDKKALMSAEYGVTASGMELTITDPLSRKTKIIGNREFAHVYRMRIRAEDKRGSTAAVRITYVVRGEGGGRGVKGGGEGFC